MTEPFHPPGTPEYAAFPLAATAGPAGVFTARSVGEVVRAVAAARRAGRPLRLTTTGLAMGRTAPLTGSLLLRPLLDAPIRVDPEARTAWVPAGRTWSDVLPETIPYGLTAVHGSSATAGVIGYLLGGGLSFYGRRFGLAANTVRSLTLVLADGSVVEASATHRPDLLWALRGGGGGFGVVVAAEIELVPMHSVVTGTSLWDPADTPRVAPLWQAWSRTAPREITTRLRLLPVPSGRRVLALDGAVVAPAATDRAAARRIADEMLSALVPPVAGTWAAVPPETLVPAGPEPRAVRSDSALVRELDADIWAELVAAGPGLLTLELRQLGGALATPAVSGGALDSLAAPLLYYAAGPAGQLRAVRAALAPFLTGYTAPTFVEHFDLPQRTLDDYTRVRVERIRHDADPTGLFAGDIDAVRK
ncbi:hypothetical protein Aab01nite_11820 [Paractinoplanes abujensis]|uniref:FAD-binding PCMH-type domain-containing protein n=1 Tax=Paractinoplanes abujensis TaxID=882441 RepID=A0A7W7CPM7_9ACTN|nr:FAD-binding protein [Actinoplanes abujensis]MBB4690995.1 hypothetical protein [Actinoplanes abujensis]GID17592.1 hypothetical protein Aab01nite_11820 [Actinoplanes abujensis]